MQKRNGILITSVILVAAVLAGGIYLLGSRKPISPIPGAGSPTQTQTTQSPTSTGTTQVNIYLIALEDNGQTGEKIGCGDSVIPVKRTISATKTPLQAAYKELLSIKTRDYGQSGFYNSLYSSALTFKSANIDARGKATVQLTGQVSLGGVCDSPRFKAQLEKTAMQFPTVKSIFITINDKPLDEILSEK
jgi:hypothetical protein